MTTDITINTHGKCIITGEHAVIRGHQAIVLPVKSRQLSLTFQAQDTPLTLAGDAQGDTRLAQAVMNALACARELTEQKQFYGHMHFSNNITVGAGLGASAALCVAIAKWCASQHYIKEHDIYEFARTLENIFHGESSGIDIAGVMSDTPVIFQEHQYEPIHINWPIQLTLHDSNTRCQTKSALEKVSLVWQQDSALAAALDKQMHESSSMIQNLLANPAPQQAVQAIELGADCFSRWGLVNQELIQCMQALKQQGALACKPTGSGLGGFVLAAWEKDSVLPKEKNVLEIF